VTLDEIKQAVAEARILYGTGFFKAHIICKLDLYKDILQLIVDEKPSHDMIRAICVEALKAEKVETDKGMLRGGMQAGMVETARSTGFDVEGALKRAFATAGKPKPKPKAKKTKAPRKQRYKRPGE
jgi:hypothetical protein